MHHHTLSSRVRLIAAALSLCALFVANAGSALAHPAPSVLHDYIVSLTPTTLTLESYLRVSPELVPQVYRSIDTNGDGQTSQDETEAWFRAHPSKLGLALDGKALQPSISQAPSISKNDLLQSVDHPIKMTYTVALAEPVSGKHRIQVTYGDNYVDYDEYYISVANDTANDSSPQSVSRNKYPATYQIVYHIPAPNDTNVPQGEMAPPPYYVGAATPAPVTPTAVPTAPSLAPISGQTTSSGGSGVAGILDSIRNWHGDPSAAVGLVLLALLLGALHALTPGHGKTMVAAYLIGSKGRVKDAVFLGGVVTFTHTIGVVILGLILLFVSTFTVPRNLQPILELIAGVLVIGLGGYLLLTRWRDSRAAQTAATPTRTTGSRKAAQPAPVARQSKVLATSGAGATAQALPTTPVALATAEPIEHSHTTDHSHGSGSHTHTHDGHTHTHAVPDERLGFGALVGLGVTGGIVPCPDALAILLLATGVGQFGLGLGLVVSFSLGLAAVLIAIGVALVTSKGALEKSRVASFTKSDLWTRWVPLASAATVVVVGLVMTFTAFGSFR